MTKILNTWAASAESQLSSGHTKLNT